MATCPFSHLSLGRSSSSAMACIVRLWLALTKHRTSISISCGPCSVGVIGKSSGRRGMYQDILSPYTDLQSSNPPAKMVACFMMMWPSCDSALSTSQGIQDPRAAFFVNSFYLKTGGERITERPENWWGREELFGRRPQKSTEH